MIIQYNTIGMLLCFSVYGERSVYQVPANRSRKRSQTKRFSDNMFVAGLIFVISNEVVEKWTDKTAQNRTDQVLFSFLVKGFVKKVFIVDACL